MKGRLPVKAETLVPKFQLIAAKIYNKISNPLQLHDGSQYVVAVVEEKTPWEIHLYEFANTQDFLARPDRFIKTFDDPLKLEQAFGFAGSSIHKAKMAGYRVLKRKIVPDTVETRRTVREMLRTDPCRASGIFFLTTDGRLYHFEDISATLAQ